MSALPLRLRAILLAAGAALLASSGWAVADPPSRVARLGYLSGAVSFSPAGEDYWMLAGVNRPLTTGDRLWSDADGRAELQVGGADVRMGAGAGVTIPNLDDEIAQLQLTQGALNVRVRRLGKNQVFEVDTPNLAFTLRRPGAYRIEVDPDGQFTTIVMRSGQGEVYGQDAAYVIDSGRSYRFTGTDLREDRRGDMPRLDDFDRWSNERDHRYENSVSGGYVSPDMIGLWGDSIGVSYVDIRTTLFQREIVDLLPERYARANHMILLYQFGDAITAATSEPLNQFAIQEAERMVGKPISPVFCFPEDIDDAIEIVSDR